MRAVVLLFALIASWWLSSLVQPTYADSGGVRSGMRPFGLEAGEGEARDRRPRPWQPIAASSFTFKIDSENGPANFLFATETLQPGAVIPYHRHLHEDEMLFIGSGVAHVRVGSLDRDAHAGAIVFIPRDTWITLKNVGKRPIAMLFGFDAPNYERFLRCISVLHGSKAAPMTRADFAVCVERGDADYKH